ncbi:insulin-like receptor [Adelges cooleyi]|uniref:insulin-like receptor n=1 Tax=Adelges cooleyi TaxID=133065 RepID=UPI00218042F9|nr:insulin-like receptor [Adelges cooleyi]XP_050440179.1 insulin-like receptor [Adelges cooleyi]
MCGDYDEIHCLRDNCPGIDQCRLCGRSVVSPIVQNDCCICLWPSAPSRLYKSPTQQHRKAWLFSSKSVWQSNFLCIALWCVAVLSVSQASTEEYRTQITTIPTFTTTTSNPVQLSEGRICQSKDIRNRADNLKSLRGCRVIEGFLQIVLIDNANETSFESLSFPELREITGYLLLYRVNGLKSLAKLFPNLSVIRGQDLFMSYAIAIYEMVHLHELGLYTLKDVVRGAIYITKNPMLCFTQTIDWNKIAPSGKGSHVIYENRPGNACPVCPWTNDPSCAVSSTNEPLCWNTDHCQRICPSDCNGLCSMDGKCCHEQCLGGCVEENKQDKCFACKELEIERNCVTACPANTLIYQNRRCISEYSCYHMPRPRVELQNGLHPQSWKPFNNTSCLMECPPGYEEVPTENSYGKVHECRQCAGPCRKVCIAANVESIQSAQKLKGCVVINGSLEIQIRGGTNIVKELEESLSMIEEITGYLKVVRSFPLVSLSFLKKLKLIGGETLESSKYALVVLDNQNLVELWDWSTRKQDGELKIVNGRIFFHFNPKLCLYRIKELQTKLGPKFGKVDDLEVAPNSNGDKIACNVSKLNVRTDIVDTRSVVLKWPPFLHYDTRTLLGYVVYYLEAPYQNVSLYDGRDACGGDGWKTDDVESTETTEELFAIITNLKPYTQYAYYVKTYTVASESIGAQSDISYFYTLPDTPGPPQHLEATDWTTDSVTIKWLPPAEPNGQLSHYVIKYSPNNISGDERLHERNYCENTINMNDLPGKNNNPNNEVVKSKGNEKEKDCNCTVQPEKKPTKIKDEQQIKTMIEFENNLQNIVFVKNPHRKNENSQKTKRDVSNYDIAVEFPNNTIIASKVLTDSDKNDAENEYIKKIVPSDILQYTIKDNVTHFTTYNIELYVCRLSNKNETAHLCSTRKAMTSGKTLKKDSADKLDESKFVVSPNSTSVSVKISWSEPQNSNGPIVSYQLEYAKVGDNLIPSIKCITRQQFNKSGGSYILSSLLPGNYSFRVRAQSLAGYGEYTSYKYYNINEFQAITKTELFTIVILAAVIICVVIILVFFGLHRYYKNKLASTRLFVTCNPDYISCEYQADEWEIPREDIEVLEPLGRGSFGMVYRGIWKKKDSDPVPCAIKTVTENNNIMVRHDFLSEANVMKEFCTTHVVRLYGVVSQGQPAFVLMELMTQGDLKSFLLKHRPEMTADPLLKPPTLRDILRMAIEIADGMAYLSFKKYVHRDLAARNCMVGEKNIVKVGDFGLTRDIYQTDYYRKDSEGMMPIRWMAPESLKHGLFTCFSDVWSYGVVLWEMVTLAAQPYRGENDKNVIAYVSSGGIMEKPHDCPDILYDCMKLCWRFKASERPTFPELVKMFLPCAREEFSKMSFYHNELQSETPRLEVSDNGVNESETSERERKQLEQDQITAALRNFGSSNERLAPKADLEEDDDDDDDDEEDSDNGNELQRLRIDDFVYKQRPPNGYMSIHNGNGNINTTMC